VLGAKDENHARVGPLFAGFIKILPVFIFVLPGTMLLALINKGDLPDLEDSKNAYDFMIRHLLPPGLTGVMAAALLAALMSTVSGALNSIATLFSYDLYKRWKPDTPDHQLVVVGRIATFVAMILAIVWSPFVGRFETMYQGVNTVISHLAPPVTVVFLFGVLWRRASRIGALATLMAGSVLGFIVFLLGFYKEQTGYDVPFMMSAFYLFLACSAIMVGVSLAYPHQHTAASERLVWNSPLDALRGKAWRGIGNYKFLALLLFVTMVTLYIVFA
jgi:SSS family solute:Na+ symporter